MKVRAAAATVEVLQANLNQPAPCIGVQNERSKRISNSPHQAQQNKNSNSPNKFGAKRSLSLGGMRNENVDPEELRSSEGICRSLGCEVFQDDTAKEPCVHDELTTLHHEKQQYLKVRWLFVHKFGQQTHHCFSLVLLLPQHQLL